MSLASEILERGADYVEDVFRLLQENEYASIAVDLVTGSHPILKLAYLALILLAVVWLAIRYRSKSGFLTFVRQIGVFALVVICIVMAIAIIAHLKASMQ